MIMQTRGRFSILTSLCLAVWGLLCFAVPLQAQVSTGTITGFVEDASGAMIAGVQITVTNQDKGTSTRTKTNSAGEYIVPELVPGVYTVVAEQSGFKTASSPDNHVAVGQRVELDIKLEVGPVTSKVEVHAQAPLLSTETSGVGRVVGSQQFDSLPLNGRFYQDVAMLMPGAVPGGWADFSENAAGAGAINPMYMSFNGTNYTATRYLIDGVQEQEPANSYQVITPSLDAIEEIDVNTSSPSAEIGSFGGGVVSTVIRSGANTLHGSLFEFWRNKDLNARGFFDVSKVPYNTNQFGGSLGGPIIRDRWFFFVDYEGYRQHDGVTSIMTVPTALQRQGNFTEPGQNVIYNPLTGTPFQNNTIPTDMINPISAKLVALYLLPNASGLINNFITVGAHSESVNQFDAKTDLQINAANRFFLRESYLPRNSTDPIPGSIFFGGDHGINRNHNAAVGLTTNISPTKVNELRFGFTRYKTDFYAADTGINENLNVGIPNGNLPGTAWGDGVADVSIDGWSSIGSGYPSLRFSHTFDLLDNFVWQTSRHTLKFGGDLQESWSMCCNARSNGSATFDGNLTSNQGAGGTGIGMASFLLGYATSLGQTFWTHEPDMRNQILGLYFQDDFRASKKLTLNLGLRYDRIPQPVEKFNDLANYDLHTGLMVKATPGDRKPGITNFNVGFAPRVGLAYSLTPKTVIRTAYGISWYNAAFGANAGAMETTYPFFGFWSAVNPDIFVPSLSISQGFPAEMAPPVYVSSNEFELPSEYSPNVHTIQRPDMVQMWNFGVQHEFTDTFMVSAAYVGNHETQLFRYKYLNLAEPGPGPIADRAPYANLGCPDNCVGSTQIIGHTSDGSSMYDALQIEVQKRVSRGLQFTASYTWSKIIDDMYVQYLDPYSDRNTRGYGTYHKRDYPNIFSLSYVYTLPFGTGNRWASRNKVADQFIGGWRVGGIARLHSGDPLRIWVLNSLLNNTQGNLANMVPGCKPHVIGSPNEWMDSSCFSSPPLYTWGNSGVGHVRGPGLNDWDLQAAKQIKLPREGMHLDVTCDFFNVANHPIFGDPDTNVGDPAWGTITGLNWNPRYIQIGLHLEF